MRPFIPLALSLTLAAAAPSDRPPAPREISHDQQIFQAVLEGLYTDGVRNDDVDRILLTTKEGGYVHFIRGCPLCNPALEAFRHYRARPTFVTTKGGGNTWGPGLAKAVRARLASGSLEERLGAINGLLERWVRNRMDLLRLSDRERKEWEIRMAEGRKIGMALLAAAQRGGQMPEWKGIDRCAICDGSNAACEKKR